MIRNTVLRLAALGKMPASSADEEVIEMWQDRLSEISKPITEEEAAVLIKLFGDDDCYGLAWTLLHLIESTPGWPVSAVLNSSSGIWIETLRGRVG